MAKRRTQPAAKMEEVTDLQADSGPSKGHTLETGIIFATFVSVVVGLILAQYALAKYFDGGLLG